MDSQSHLHCSHVYSLQVHFLGFGRSFEKIVVLA